MSDKKPVIFISYSHKDEPERDPDGDIHWLEDILSYVAPAVNGTYELWTDEDITGGTDWESKIKEKLAACDICILLVSRHSLASKYVIEVEIDTILKRQQQRDAVQLYPIVLSPFPQTAAPASLLALNLRPRLDKPLSGFSRHHRGTEISKIADEIVGILHSKTAAIAAAKTEPPKPPAFVHISGLPETAYEHLVGREAELKRLDDAWVDRNTNILSLIAEGGAGKSALVNEWLTQLRVDNYRGAEIVLGWSFYSQGTKERATSAEQFLDWAVEKLEIEIKTTSATAKGDAIAEAMTKRRVLLLLDGCEPLQHGLDTQLGQLKDQGLRALLRRFAATPPSEGRALVVLTSRLSVKDIARWEISAAPVVNVQRLSDEAGAALLRDDGVWGTDMELEKAVHDFGGHPLALGLLASFLKETQTGDVRRRDHIRAFYADAENPRHDHAKRVMESYEKEWLTGQPVLLGVINMVGLFDRPASGDCLKALRAKPAIGRLTDQIVCLNEGDWQRAVARLRYARLLAPKDLSAPDALDAHPLVREWFGERLRQTNEAAWKAAHGRLYEHLRDETKEGNKPTLEALGPLYQAIGHGSRAGQYQEALDEIYRDRISRRKLDGALEYYSMYQLGAYGSDLAAISWFFEKPYETPLTLPSTDKAFVLGVAAYALSAQGRLREALPGMRLAIRMSEAADDRLKVAILTANLSDVELLVGEIDSAVATGARSIELAEAIGDEFRSRAYRAMHAAVLHAAGRRGEAELLFAEAERQQQAQEPRNPFLYSLQGGHYCELLLDGGKWEDVHNRAAITIAVATRNNWLGDVAFDTLTIGRAKHGRLLENILERKSPTDCTEEADVVRSWLDDAVDRLRAATVDRLMAGNLARAAFRRSIGAWSGATRDLEEVEEIAEPGLMRLHLCDMALERTRLAYARIEAFAPLRELIEDGPPRPGVPDADEVLRLREESTKQLAIAADHIKTCGYHRRDEELTELEAVLRGEREFADLPPRV
jgi:tetratricopeptide (TPR) repeat protein